MIKTKYGYWIEEGDEIHLTNVRFLFPKGMNPLAFLEFIGAEIHPLESTARKDE